MKAIISPNVRIRHPEHFEIGEHSIACQLVFVGKEEVRAEALQPRVLG